MSENVISIGKAAIQSERREQFLQAVAQTFERYVAEYGYEPDAIVYTMNGTHQASLIGWEIQGASQGGVVSVLALSGAHVMSEAQQGRQGL
jgi:hypothetical protein